jgi:hypothetical protein
VIASFPRAFGYVVLHFCVLLENLSLKGISSLSHNKSWSSKFDAHTFHKKLAFHIRGGHTILIMCVMTFVFKV